MISLRNFVNRYDNHMGGRSLYACHKVGAKEARGFLEALNP